MRPTLLSLCLLLLAVITASAGQKTNFVVIFCDDLGYGDLGCYGSTKNRTPRIDQLAQEGMRFTDFYSSSPVCTPSRASLMTGCYPRRVGLHEAETGHWVLIPRNRRGLHVDEITLPEHLDDAGYISACVGKWHLGDQPEHLPTAHGFHRYFGIPYSNDMQQAGRGDPPLPLVEDLTVIEAPADQSTLTRRYTEKAIEFIEANQKEPFFLYLPHTFPHLPLFASPDFHGQSANGRYGDSVEEIDWSTGQILDCLERLGLSEHTMVIFTSDNGSNGRNGGSNAPLAGNKGSTMEGGMRVPMIVRFPGRVAPGSVCSELATTMDLFPTIAYWAGLPMHGRKIDGHDITPLLRGEAGAKSPYQALYYYRRRQLQAIRMGDWKWHLPLEHTYPRWTTADVAAKGRAGKLINLATDLQETTDLAADQPEVMATMRELAQRAVAELGNEAMSGSEQRPAETLAESKPMTLPQKR